MFKLKRFSLSAAVIMLFCFTQLGLTIQTAHAEKMGKEEMAKQWKKLKKKGWSRQEMEQALKLSERESGTFDKIVSLKNNNIPMGAIVQSFKICDGKIRLVNELWQYVTKYKFSPKEVAKVIKTFPPNEQQRYEYFKYRAGGSEQLAKRQEAVEEDQKIRGKAKKGYSQNEVMNIFKRVRFDVKLVKKYFNRRDSGASKQKAWGNIRKELQTQKEKERQKQEEKRQAEEQRRKEREEKRQKLKEYQEKQKKAQEEDSEEEESAKTTTLKSLLGGDDDSESEDKNDGDESESTNNGVNEDQEQADEQKEKQDNSSADEEDEEK